MVKEYKMSQARKDELEAELLYSKTTRADEIAELIKEARGFGLRIQGQKKIILRHPDPPW